MTQILAKQPETYRDTNGVVRTKWSDDVGTPELHQREKLVEVDTNEGGETRRVYRTKDTLQFLFERGSITPKMEEAGRTFQRAFHVAHCRATPWLGDRVQGGGRDEPETVAGAKRTIARAMQAMGGHGAPAADTVWHVVGEGLTLKEYAQRRRWNGQVVNGYFVGGRKFRWQDASGALVSGLAILVKHWGL